MTDKRDSVANQLQSTGRSKCPASITTSNGRPIETLTASLTSGPQGAIALKDFTLIDHLAAFDRERIPERVVHAKGAGAFGYFQVTSPEIQNYCSAKMFSAVGKKTPAAVRFSTVGGESGSADTARDPRGFAMKFYTEEGNWDLVGNNTPIFFIRDPILFPSFIHTQKRNPVTHCKDPDAFWDFISLRPETVHQVSFLFSDRGTPDGYRHMNGYGSHTFKTVNAAGVAYYVKWHFKTDQGVKNLTSAAADQLASSDPDYATRDLYNAIDTANFPSWTTYFQVMTVDQANKLPYNPFDVTKVWPHAEFPLHEIGRLVLDRNPANYFAEVEQLAFSPAHMVPGIEASPDKMLQGRLFSYSDTHRHRLGVNYQSIPVNCPYATQHGVHNAQRDGAMRVDGNQAGAPNYFPNSFGSAAPATASTTTNAAWHTEPSARSLAETVARYETGGSDQDNFTQAGQFYRKVLSAAERERLTDNIAGHLVAAQDFIQTRAIANFAAADANYGRSIKEKVAALKKKQENTKTPKVCPAAKLSPARSAPTVDGKRSNL